MRVSQSVVLSAMAAAIFVAPVVSAQTPAPFIVRDIRVEGLQRVEPGTVFSYLPIKVGEQFNEEKGGEALRALFATGFFKDVRLRGDKDVLVVIVEEQPAIAQIEFSGTKVLEKDMLKKWLRSIGVAEARYYNKSAIEKAEQEIKRLYVGRGHYAADVVTTITPIERNRVSIVFNVDEGSVAKIRRINIVGNKVFSESDLLAEMQLSTPNWLSWYTRTDQYSRQKLTADLEALRSYYLDRGYLEFAIESSQVAITPDKRDVSVTVSIKEGERFTIDDINFAGELLGKQNELTSKLTLKKGDVFSATKLAESTKAITELLGSYGYAFAAINPQPKLDKDKRQVALTLVVDPGKRVYVRQIQIAGNNRTRDDVIRREMRQSESAWYDSDKVKLSRERINRTGYFTDVTANIQEIPNVPDQVDMAVNVVEKPTGSVNLSAGYSSTDKVVLGAGIQQDNVFGTGTSLGVNINTSKVNRTLSLTQYDPYFTLDGISRVTDVYYKTSQPFYYLNDPSYKIVTQGGSFKFGVPFSEIDRVFFGLGLEHMNVGTLSSNSTPNLVAFVNEFGSKVVDIPFTVGWARDNRDSALVPTSGRYQQANLELGTPAGKLQYYRLSYQHQYYYPVAKGYTLAFNTEIGYGHGYSGDSFPMIKNYLAGGIGSVRGYETNTIGPSSVMRQTNGTTQNVPTGGASKLIGSIEFAVPLPGSGVDRTVRLFSFIDAGAIYKEGSFYSLADLRYSYGLGFSWISPIGPLKFSYGIPVKLKEGDKAQRFQFQIGTSF